MIFECLKFILNLSHSVRTFVTFIKIYQGIQSVAITIIYKTECCMSLCKLRKHDKLLFNSEVSAIIMDGPGEDNYGQLVQQF